MKVAVIGATGVIGSSVVPSLVAAGHDVFAMARTEEKAASLEHAGATAVRASLGDHDGLVSMFEGCDAVCNLATHVPHGVRAAFRGSWRENDWLRTEGVRRVVDAARQAHVRRVVQESVSFLYADNGDDWIDEQSPLEINCATEPASVGESHVAEYQHEPRHGVVLRFGTLVGDDELTRWWLRCARNGMPVGMGSPDGWVHLLHVSDVGPAVVAALTAPSGTYNVGAEPVRREDLVRGYATAAGRSSAAFMGPLTRRIAGSRSEPLTRSLRVSSESFTAQTGWTARRARFDPSWFDLRAVESEKTR